ncbi:MAG: hypothetical protein QME75_12470 [Deltaproteobacteria bacterium]|nr:hypothetical protein [Deltaproteobacteria bacterium]
MAEIDRNDLRPFLPDPREEVRRRIIELENSLKPSEMDALELKEREEAAQAYAGENEKHFADYCEECIKDSVRAMEKVRRRQRELWDVYQEEAPPAFARKEKWQSRVVYPKPFMTVQAAKAIVRKAFEPQFLSIDNEQDEEAAAFWQKLMDLMLSPKFADFGNQFSDACEMGFATGQGMEMVPIWRTGRGLRYDLVEPAKIHRDPNALSRDPQSGLYWVHQEWQDYYLLKEQERKGLLQNVGDFSPGNRGRAQDQENLSREAVAEKKGHVWHVNRFRSFVLTSEFWGTVLSPRGEMLLPNATFTVAADRVIRPPRASRYPSLRWPGTGFSPLPHLLRFDGRSLLQGVKTLWEFMCSLLCLHNDNLNWKVNPPSEIDVSILVDPDDLDDYPGKQWLTRGALQGMQACRTIERRTDTGEILAYLNFGNQAYDEATLPSVTRGLPGYRAEVTAREAAQNLDQAMTIFGQIGKNLERGALAAIVAGAETVAINITFAELALFLGADAAMKYADPSSPTGLRLPQLTTGAFHVSGISALMQDWEVLRNIRDLILPLFTPGSVFLPYLRPYMVLQALEKRLNLQDEGIVVDQQTAKSIDAAQQQQQEEAIEAERLAQQAEAAAMATPREEGAGA